MMNIVREDWGVAVELGDGSRLAIRLIVGIGCNYAGHAAEQGADVPDRPMVFYKSPGSAGLHGDAIVIPPVCRDEATGGPEQVDFEAELGVVLGRDARDVAEADALDCVLGYCCANDVSARWWQKKGSGGQFCRGKSFDSFCPIGPALVPADRIDDPQDLRVVCRVSGETMQEDSTASMIFPVRALIAELSRGTTLPAGTLILTGTPSGVGMARTPQRFLRDGDVVEVEIEGIGLLRNVVRNG